MAFQLQASKGENGKKILVAILWMGEPQIGRLLLSLSKLSRDYVIEISVIAYHSNLAAHMLVWDWFNSRKEEIRIKIDGDMEIAELDILKKNLSSFINSSFYSLRLQDHITGQKISGVNLFTSGYALNTENCDDLFPDNLFGERILIENSGLSHCVDPTVYQIGIFVGHRLKKSFVALKLGHTQKAFSYLRQCFFAFKVHFSTSPAWFIVSFCAVLRKNYRKIHDHHENEPNRKNELEKLIREEGFTLLGG